MYADIESLVLSGNLFNPPSPSSSPRRSPSPDAGWHDDEPSDGNDSDAARSKALDSALGSSQHESIGMGPGRTGVKGVIRDRNEASASSRSKYAREADELNKRMEKASLGGKTFLEEERADILARGLAEDGGAWAEARAQGGAVGRAKNGKFGYLREVGLDGFVPAVEQEARGVWVVVHLYEPSLDRCYSLDESLLRLARIYPDTKFLRARASVLGFALSASASSSSSRPPVPPSRIKSGSIRSTYADEDDPYDDGSEFPEGEVSTHEDDEEGEEGTGEVDTDMLPTMLVYRDGDLVHNWVRVDWEVGRANLEGLLSKYHIIAGSILGDLPADDDDLLWSDEDEKTRR